MFRRVIPVLFLLVTLISTGCSEDPSQKAGSSGDTRQSSGAEPTAEPTAAPEPTEAAGAQSAGRGDSPEYIVIGESEREEAGVRTAQVIVTAKKSSKPELRRIVEDLKGKYQNSDAASVEIMDGAAGFGKAGSAVIMYNDKGARRFGYSGGVPNEQGYVLKVVD